MTTVHKIFLDAQMVICYLVHYSPDNIAPPVTRAREGWDDAFWISWIVEGVRFARKQCIQTRDHIGISVCRVYFMTNNA